MVFNGSWLYGFFFFRPSFLVFRKYGLGFYRVQNIGFQVQGFLSVKWFLRFFRFQGFFACFGFRVYEFLGFKAQSLGLCRCFKQFYGLQDLVFLRFSVSKVQCFLGFQDQDLGFQVRVYVLCFFQVKGFIQVFRVQGFGVFRLMFFSVLQVNG